MSDLSDEFQELGQELLTEFGSELTFTRTGLANFDPNSGNLFPTGETTYTAYGYLSTKVYNSEQTQKYEKTNTSIQGTFYRIILESDSYFPQIGDITTVGSKDYVVLGVDETRVNGITVLYYLDVQS